MTRFVVQTVSGYTPTIRKMGSSAREGLSAHVCDTVYLYEVVASYRSTDAAPVPGYSQRKLGNDGAVAAAEAHAARLNDGR
jgi:hypothetical protein